MNDRVRMIMEHFQLRQKEFANELCVAEATISNVLKGKTAPSNSLIQAIHMAYPGVNMSWLMFGEGEMLLPISEGARATYEEGRQSSLFGQNGGFGLDGETSLFDPPAGGGQSSVAFGGAQGTTGGGKASNPPASQPNAGAYRSPQVELQLVEALAQIKNANQNDKPVRRIKEIRVFFDDGTFESFVPSTK